MMLLHNLILFGRVLRGLGLEVTPGRMIDILPALELINPTSKTDFYHTLRSFLVKRQADIALFDQAFELFWKRPVGDGFDLTLQQLLAFHPAEEPQKQPLLVMPPALEPETPAADPAEEDEPVEVIELTQTYSQQEVLRHKDFGEMTPHELQQVRFLMAKLVWQLGQRRTRRLRPGGNQQIDLRRTIRQGLRYGGEWLSWPARTAVYKPRPLIVLADISGSMERYTRLLLTFLYSLKHSLHQPVEFFVFSTRLTRITHQLHHKNIELALQEVAQTVHDWSGGTRIGDAVKQFNFEWSRRVLRGGAVVLLISDGWDRGDPALLSREMARLGRLCHRLVWLNPLLGSAEYEPLTRGMQAALPHLDDFLPVHNLASLEDLAHHLQKLNSVRPVHHPAAFRK